MVQVQSTWFPIIDRNPQTFVPNIRRLRPALRPDPRPRHRSAARQSGRLSARAGAGRRSAVAGGAGNQTRRRVPARPAGRRVRQRAVLRRELFRPPDGAGGQARDLPGRPDRAVEHRAAVRAADANSVRLRRPIVVSPFGAHPGASSGLYEQDEAYLAAYVAASRDQASFDAKIVSARTRGRGRLSRAGRRTDAGAAYVGRGKAVSGDVRRDQAPTAVRRSVGADPGAHRLRRAAQRRQAAARARACGEFWRQPRRRARSVAHAGTDRARLAAGQARAAAPSSAKAIPA